jgi:hypothetical protein
MFRKSLALCALAVLLATPSFAQSPRIEVGGLFGYTFSEGVPITANVGAITYTDSDPVSSISFGFTFGVFVTPNTEVEFLWSRQATELQVTGNSTPLKADMNVDSTMGTSSITLVIPRAWSGRSSSSVSLQPTTATRRSRPGR